MVGYKLSKNDWVTPFFVIFRSVREILLVTVFCKHPVPFPHFPLYAALEHSAPTYCGKINILNQFVKETLKKWAICTLTFTLLKQLSTNKQFVDTHDSPSLAEVYPNVKDSVNITTSI